MQFSRPPCPALRPFVKSVWFSDEQAFGRGQRPGRTSDRVSIEQSRRVARPPVSVGRELVLPTGGMHLVIRLSTPLRLFDGIDDPHGRTVGHTIVGGARAGFYVRDISKPVQSVGAQLYPGAAELLLGVPAEELAGRHTPLSELWGRAAEELRERLLQTEPFADRLKLFEAELAARLPRVRGVHPAVSQALEGFALHADVRRIVEESGYSHRTFIALFRRAVGLTPKLYSRVLRFQEVLSRIAAMPDASSVEVALAAGYSDQPHFNREFREFAGLPPGEYRRLSPAWSHHVPLHGA